MTIDKLRRVMLHLREISYPPKEKFTLTEVRLAIDEEIGYTDAAFKRAIKALKRQGLLKRRGRWYFVDMEYSSLPGEVVSRESQQFKMPPGAKEEKARRKLHADDETFEEFMSHT